MNSSSSRRYASRKSVRLIAAGALLVAALGLAGCGSKAGLDPPPSAAIATPVNGVVKASNGQPNGAQADFDPVTGKPIAPTSVARKSHFLDFLID